MGGLLWTLSENEALVQLCARLDVLAAPLTIVSRRAAPERNHPSTQTSHPMITITEGAATKARAMMQEHELSTPDAGLRLGVKAGGCSGLNYVLDLVDAPNTNDRIFEQHGVRLYCDPKSYLYLNGTQVDFESNMMGGGFKFTNPNAKRSCGCGTSFAV